MCLYRFCQLGWHIVPIILALCSMLLPPSHYAHNYASIIGSSLVSKMQETCQHLNTIPATKSFQMSIETD